MASFFKKWFGGGAEEAGSPDTAPTAKEIEHEGFTIRATPYKDGGQYQLCGVIEKAAPDGTMRSHRFVRADRFPDAQTAGEMALIKGRQIIDYEGERLFA